MTWHILTYSTVSTQSICIFTEEIRCQKTTKYKGNLSTKFSCKMTTMRLRPSCIQQTSCRDKFLYYSLMPCIFLAFSCLYNFSLVFKIAITAVLASFYYLKSGLLCFDLLPPRKNLKIDCTLYNACFIISLLL